MGGTRLVLVRHGHTDALGQILAGRMPGCGLNALGRDEAARVALAMSGDPAVARVFSSPRLRARQTAEPIASATGCIVEEEAGLDEVDFGDWTANRFDALDATPGWTRWNRLRSLAATPGGETMMQVQARAIAVLQRLHDHGACTIVLVSHADVIRSVLAHALGVPIDMMHRLSVSPASRSIVALFDDSVLVEAVNLPPRA